MADRHVVVDLDDDIIEGSISIADGVLILFVVAGLIVTKVDVGRVNASAVEGIDVAVSSSITAAVATLPTLMVVVNIILLLSCSVL